MLELDLWHLADVDFETKHVREKRTSLVRLQIRQSPKGTPTLADGRATRKVLGGDIFIESPASTRKRCLLSRCQGCISVARRGAWGSVSLAPPSWVGLLFRQLDNSLQSTLLQFRWN